MHALLSPIIQVLQAVLQGLHTVGLPWGWAIVGLTCVVRVFLVPLAVKQQRATQELQRLQPELKELQTRYKDDREALQRETMALYQRTKVNPLASCLPLLVQMPIFMALYYTIRGTGALNAASFLWLPALGKPDPTYLLLVVYIVTQLVSTQISLTPETPSQQRWMMRLMPLAMALFLIRFPAGLFVYWVTTNLWTIGQLLALRRWLPPLAPVETVEAKTESAGRPALATAPAKPGRRALEAGAKRPAKDVAGRAGKPARGERPARNERSQRRRPDAPPSP